MADYASEQTLQELLAEARAMSASLQKLASVLGKAPAGNGGANAPSAAGAASAAAGLAGLAKSVSPASLALTALGSALSMVTKAFGVIGSIIGDLAGRLGNAIGAVAGFAKQMLDGTASLTSMVGMFGEMAKQIPLVGGALGGLISVIGFVTERMEKSYEMYKNLASSGITFSGSLFEMRQTIQNAGLSLKEFAGISAQNSGIFATMGGNASAGASIFLKSQQEITSGLKQEFAALGMDLNDAAGFLATYMRSQGTMNKESLRDHKANAQGALELAQQTQFLSEATGKQRKLIQEDIDAKIKEQNVEAYLAGLSAEEADAARAKYNYALQKHGKDTADMVMTGLMTGVVQPATDAQSTQAAITRNGTVEFAKSLVNAKGGPDEMARTMAQANAKLVVATDRAYKDIGTVNALGMAQGQKDIFGQGSLAERTRNLKNGQLKTEAEMVEAELALRRKIKDELPRGDAAGIGATQMTLKEAGLKLNSAIDGVIGSFSGPLANALKKAAEFIGNNADKIKEYGDKFANWLKPWVDKFTSVKSWDEFKVVMNAFWTEMKEKVGPILKDLWNSVKPVLANAVSSLFEQMWQGVKTSLIPRMLRSDTDEEKAADIKKKIADLEKQEATAKAALEKNPNDANAQRTLKMRQSELSTQRFALKELQGGSTAPAPAPDQAATVRDWAFKLMTGGAKEEDVPSEIKDQVATAKQDPSLVKQAEDYKAQAAQAAAQKFAREVEAEQAARRAASQPTSAAPPPPAAAPTQMTRVQDSSASTANLLNTQLATLVRASLETAEHTKRAASILASRGNALKG